MIRFVFSVFVLFFMSMSSISFSYEGDYGDRFDKMVESMLFRNSAMESAGPLRARLVSEAPDMDELGLWRMLWTEDERSRCSAAMAIIDRVFPEGDPSRWEEVSGFVMPREIPRVLIGLDGFYVALTCLPHIENGMGLAGLLLESMASSPRGRYLYIVNPPEEMAPVIEKIAFSIGLVGDWSPLRTWGHLPTASPVRGYIPFDRALSEEMQFLDNWGTPRSNGPYCWDRVKGKIYRIKDPDDPFWIIGGK